MRRFVLFLASMVPALAGELSVGVKGGVPLSDAFETGFVKRLSYSSATRRYLIGPTIEVRLPFRLGLEFDALYERLGYESMFGIGGAAGIGVTRANAWEFPLLLKYRLMRRAFTPYLVGGPTFNHLGAFTEERHLDPFTGPQEVIFSGQPPELRTTARLGIALGGGLDVRAAFLHVSPEIRYTHWGRDAFRATFGVLRSNNDQVDFLLGIRF